MGWRSMAKVAITGASGFIGRHLVVALSEQGHSVYKIGRDFAPVDCDRIYHLACPSTTEYINNHTSEVVDIILDGTRRALDICPRALFINASTIGVKDLANTAQGAYNIAKRCMELYLEHSGREYINYRLPSVYGKDAHADSFIMRCTQGTAYYPADHTVLHYIAHVDDVVNAMVNLTKLTVEEITLGEIYEQFNSGRRGLHR